MNAVISGRAGLALLIEGESLMSLDVDDLETLVPRRPSDLRFLLADATDLVTLENTGREEIAQRLDLEHDIACSLDMTLIALDPGASMELRAEAVAALDELLADASVIERLEITMYAKPLPDSADLMGALLCTYVKTEAARSFFERLDRDQTAIRAVREAWDALPDHFFGDEPAAKAVFHDVACNEGLLRMLAVSYADKASVSAFRIKAFKNTSITNLRNYREVLHRWCASIRTVAGTDWQVIGSENDSYEEPTETLQHATDMNTPQGREPLVTVTMKELLEAGVHFGHQVRRWNPKMKEFVLAERNGIYIIDLQKTQRLFKEAVKFVTQKGMDGASFMFVGTKRQAQDAVEEEAKRCGQFYVNQRWLGGLLTNFQAVQKSIQRMKDIEAMRTDGRFDALTKKERLGLDREHAALEKNLAGIRDMKVLPDVIFIIDSNKEEIAVHEANTLGITTVAIVDTNCNPDGIDYIVPGNDDAVRAVRLFAAKMADAVIEGQRTLKEGGAEIGEAAEGAEAVSQRDLRRRHVKVFIAE